MPLGMANAGDTGVIRRIAGQDEARRHLAELGFGIGQKITVVSRMGGSLILSVRNSRIALDQEMSMRIIIESQAL